MNTAARAYGAAAALRATHSSLAVEDLERSVAFYREAFGCDIVFQDRGMTGLIQSVTGIPAVECDLAILSLPASEQLFELIAFRNPAAPWDSSPPAGHIEFAVADLEASGAAVERLGARLVGEVTMFPEGPSAYFREPGGSVFELTQYVE
jgi:predicted enzyme related to lactoylglutathione lyase